MESQGPSIRLKEQQQLSLATLKQLRMNAKREHTKTANHIYELLRSKGRLSECERCERQFKVLTSHCTDADTRYVLVGNFNVEQRIPEEGWALGIEYATKVCSRAIDDYFKHYQLVRFDERGDPYPCGMVRQEPAN